MINIVLFWFNDDWGQYGRTYEKVAEHLAKLPEVNKVVCIFPPVFERQGKSYSLMDVRKISNQLYLVKQVYPINTKNYISQLFAKTSLRIWLLLNGFKKSNTILWLFPPHPYLEALLNQIPHHIVVSQIVDDFTQLDKSFWLYGHAVEQYPKVPLFSDLIITSSKPNYNKFKGNGADCWLFENAVDEIFIKNYTPQPCTTGITNPRIGYIGWITERTDIDLLMHIARCKPEWRVVIAGPSHGDALEQSNILCLPNVEYLGALPYKSVPDYLSTLDVCILPHKDNTYSRSMSPLKLYQYLASGRPIVSTNIQGLDSLRQYLLIAHDYSEFMACVDKAINNDSVNLAEMRLERAKEETWDNRIREIFSVVKLKFLTKNS